MFQVVSLIQFKCSLVVTQTTQLKKIQVFSTRILLFSFLQFGKKHENAIAETVSLTNSGKRFC